MTDEGYVPERRRAADLCTGDRIVPGDLIGADEAEEVLGVFPFVDDIGDTPCVAVVVRPDGRSAIFLHYWIAEQSIALAADSGAPVPEGVAGQPVGRAAGQS
jgi:hypothetical protein